MNKADLIILAAKKLGKRGGQASVKSRFTGKSKKEISEMMSKVRNSKASISDQEIIEGLNRGVKRSQRQRRG